MIGQTLAHRALGSLHRQSERRFFPGLVGVFSFTATITQTVPVEWVVVTGALANRRRWLTVALSAATASGAAALGLYFAFHHFGWGLLAERYPDLPASQAWIQATIWMSRYGTVALFALMALPLPVPKLPALAFAGIYRLPIVEVGLAIWAGKILKYSAYSYGTVRFPAVVRRLAEIRDGYRPAGHRVGEKSIGK